MQGSFDSSFSRSLNVKTAKKMSIFSLNTCVLGKWSLTRGEIYLDFHRVYTSMVMNADQRKWRQIRISAVSPWDFEDASYVIHGQK